MGERLGAFGFIPYWRIPSSSASWAAGQCTQALQAGIHGLHLYSIRHIRLVPNKFTECEGSLICRADRSRNIPCKRQPVDQSRWPACRVHGSGFVRAEIGPTQAHGPPQLNALRAGRKNPGSTVCTNQKHLTTNPHGSEARPKFLKTHEKSLQ